MSFQTSVSLYQAPGIEGEFASSNPSSSTLAGEGAFVAGPAGLTIAKFGWADANRRTVSNAGSGLPSGFVSRASNIATLTAYPYTTGNVILPGKEVTLHDAGDFWARTTTAASVGQKVFAIYGTGSIATGATGSTPVAAAAYTGSISGTTLTVTGTPTGSPIAVGQPVVGASAGTVITAMGTGTGGAGTYTVSNSQTLASTSLTGTAAIETQWYVGSICLAGEVFKMATRVQA